MKIAICDDEPVFLSHLKALLQKDSFEKEYDLEIKEYDSGEALIKAYEAAEDFDVLFLDILMKTMDGLETAGRLRSMGCRCLLIFLTSMTEYMQQGYEVRAFRYLLKDQTQQELARVMEAVRGEFLTQDYFAFSYERNSFRVPKADILYLESKKRLIYLHTCKGETYQFYQKLDELEAQLGACGFMRCHKSFLVQERYVTGWREHVLWLEGNIELPVSRAYEKEVNRRLMLRSI